MFYENLILNHKNSTKRQKKKNQKQILISRPYLSVTIKKKKKSSVFSPYCDDIKAQRSCWIGNGLWMLACRNMV